MKGYQKTFLFLLIIFDIIFYFLSLLLLIIIRYGLDLEIFYRHFKVFLWLLPLWLLILYANNLYNFLEHKIALKIIKGIIGGILFSIIFFYFIPYFKITPKTNLIIFGLFYASFLIISRIYVLKILFEKIKLNCFLIVPREYSEKFKKEIEDLGFVNIVYVGEKLPEETFFDKTIDFVLISRKININKDLQKLIKDKGFTFPIIELIDFYEKNFGRIPLEEIDEYWILKEIISLPTKIDILLKKILDIFLSLIIGLMALPLILLIALGIYLNSPGPILFKQKRIGKNNKEFVLYKFRTMKNLEDPGIWAQDNDQRIFWFGKILRRLHLDELPQIVNILKGELSFVGPRPEQVNIVEKLTQEIPFFNIRHLINPGITGWSQVNYKYAQSVEESKIKLEYDLYYLKNRSLFLDLLIFLKTIFNI